MVNRVAISPVTSPVSRPLNRKLQPLDVVELWGVVKSVEGDNVTIVIGEITLIGTRFSGSPNCCAIQEDITLKVV